MSITPLCSLPLFLQGHRPLGRSLCTRGWEEAMPMQALILCVQPWCTMSIALYSPAKMCFTSTWLQLLRWVSLKPSSYSICLGFFSPFFSVQLFWEWRPTFSRSIIIFYLLWIYFVSIKLLESANENFHGKQKRKYASSEEIMKDEITPLLTDAIKTIRKTSGRN